MRYKNIFTLLLILNYFLTQKEREDFVMGFGMPAIMRTDVIMEMNAAPKHPSKIQEIHSHPLHTSKTL